MTLRQAVFLHEEFLKKELRKQLNRDPQNMRRDSHHHNLSRKIHS